MVKLTRPDLSREFLFHRTFYAMNPANIMSLAGFSFELEHRAQTNAGSATSFFLRLRL
jgi:hypothetical protein